MIKLVSIVGARPQFIKSATVSRAIKEFNRKSKSKGSKLQEILLHTGQHYNYEMSGIFFKELKLSKPKYYLGIGSGTHASQTGLMLEKIEKVLLRESPDLVMVYGDTNSTLAGALAAKKLNIMLAHVEAGLRSYNMAMPEEINRIVTDRISDILFCPSSNAVNNLRLEGIRNGHTKLLPKVIVTGDVMYDMVLRFLDIAERESDILTKLFLDKKSYYLVTVHRAANTDNAVNLSSILKALNTIARDVGPVIFPVHPRTRKAISHLNLKRFDKSLRMLPPVSYFDMLMLQKNANAVLTDSGGVQKEAYFVESPCITLRDETEWTETVKAGCNILSGADERRIVEAVRAASKTRFTYPKIYGDGKAAERITESLSASAG